MFCRTLVDYAHNFEKVKEAIQELEVMYPLPKGEEGAAGSLSALYT